MNKAFSKDILRSIGHSLGRFLAIMGIVALGAGFYAGLRMTAPDMELAADRFYDGTVLYDIRVVSTLGMSNDDLAALEAIEGVDQVMPARETDVLAFALGEQQAMRVHSLPAAAAASESTDGVTVHSADDNYLNRLVLADGRWPEKTGECVVSADSPNTPLQVGDVIRLDESSAGLDDTLKARTYTVVGTAHISYYATSTSMGTTSLGSGVIRQCMYVPESDFTDDYPITEAFITVQGAAAEKAMSDQYFDVVDPVTARIEAISDERAELRTKDLRDDAQAELDDAWAVYYESEETAYAQIDDGQKQLNEAEKDIADGRQQIDNAQKAYEDGVAELAQQREDAQAQFDAADAQLADGKAQLAEAQQQLDDAAVQIEDLKKTAADLAAMAELDPSYRPMAEQAAAARDAAIAAFDAGAAELAANQEALAAQEAELAAQKAAAKQGFSQAQQQLDNAASEIASNLVKLDNGQAEYNANLAKLDNARAEAEDQLADARRELDKAQEQIDAIDNATWYVMDRTKNFGVASFQSDGGRVDNIARVYPFIFFLVAALVALTTMTRMVEEERVLIGTYKALGFSRARIASKYVIYALLSSTLGSVLGIIILSKVFPLVIQNAYAIMYVIPPGPFPIDIPLALLSAGIGIGVTLIATIAAVLSALRETPAALMLPRVPKAGKRILLERIAPLWHKLSFTWKVTFRNLFRYKKRFVMTVIGIAGCTALLLTGFGLHDAINDILDKQFGELELYNATIRIEDDMRTKDRATLDDLLANDDRIASATWVCEKGMAIEREDGSIMNTTFVIMESPAQFQKMQVVRTRKDHTPILLAGENAVDGLVISEKMANELELSTGDTIEIMAQDDMGNAVNPRTKVTVGAIMENYVGNTVFVTPDFYSQHFGKVPFFDTAYIDLAPDVNNHAAYEALSDDLLAIKGLATCAYNDDVVDTYRTMLKSVDLIVIVLIISAAALAFIVLYNLTNINITERIREIATLKVLGFTPREVVAYIYRETILLSVIGAAVGLLLGIVMEGFVVVTAEVDQVMFGRAIHGISFLLSFLLTALFTVFVMWAMKGKLRKVSMVESLKSIE